MILVSACLFGFNCRFDGRSKINETLISSLKNTYFIPFCPEQLGGLPTPRNCAWIINGDGKDVLAGNSKVITENGEDITAQFIKGVTETEKLVSLFHIKKAYLKSKSPSCGVGKIYRDKNLVTGNGVCATMLLQKNIELISV
ncbi:MAG: DUF523 domain-containing protein [Planctomycetota bacterium]|nr:DUF523 domain-containing protein [Planctomycetota bacterium]MDE1888661.1 DUF523 domain-containing protein [Planctomycetota bacterium]MDE2215784.1 DUF523 domain-containing protein [Planctomycetota bacterium]